MLPLGQWFSRSGLVPASYSQSAWALLGSSARLLGSLTTAFSIPASPTPCWVTVALMPGCLPVVTCLRPVRASVRVGLNGKLPQPATANGVAVVELAPRLESNTPSTCFWPQLEGLSMNPARSMLTVTLRTLSGIPCQIVGIGSEIAETWAVVGSTHTA